MTSKEKVYDILKSRRWITASDLEDVGGAGALRRVRELRGEYEIKWRSNPEGEGTQYRLVGRR